MGHPMRNAQRLRALERRRKRSVAGISCEKSSTAPHVCELGIQGYQIGSHEPPRHVPNDQELAGLGLGPLIAEFEEKKERFEQKAKKTEEKAAEEATYPACLLSGEIVLEILSGETVFSARQQIASALDNGVYCIQLFSSVGSLNDMAILSEVLDAHDERSVSVVVLQEDPRKKQKINKAGGLVALGEYCKARELLESLGEMSQAKALLEKALERTSSPDKVVAIKRELAQISKFFS